MTMAPALRKLAGAHPDSFPAQRDQPQDGGQRPRHGEVRPQVHADQHGIADSGTEARGLQGRGIAPHRQPIEDRAMAVSTAAEQRL